GTRFPPDRRGRSCGERDSDVRSTTVGEGAPYGKYEDSSVSLRPGGAVAGLRRFVRSFGRNRASPDWVIASHFDRAYPETRRRISRCPDDPSWRSTFRLTAVVVGTTFHRSA